MWPLGIVIVIVCLPMILLGIGKSRSRQYKRRLKQAKENMSNHCATDKDWEIISEEEA